MDSVEQRARQQDPFDSYTEPYDDLVPSQITRSSFEDDEYKPGRPLPRAGSAPPNNDLPAYTPTALSPKRDVGPVDLTSASLINPRMRLTRRETWKMDQSWNMDNPALDTGPVQMRATREGARRTVAGWLTSIAERVGTPTTKSYDDAGFRRGSAQEFPAIPGEEMRNPDLSQMRRIVAEHWDSQDASREPSTHSATSREHVYHGMSDEPSPPYMDVSLRDHEPWPKSDSKQHPRNYHEGPSRGHLGDSHIPHARVANDDAELPSGSLFIVPDPPTQDYIHRPFLEDKINRRLSVGGARIALVGERQIGKSQLALELAFRTREERPKTHVLWISASDTENFKRSINNIGGALRLAEAEIDIDVFIPWFRKWLLDPAHGKWLIILDGFDFVRRPLEEVRGQYLLESIPVVERGSTILTSRNSRDDSELLRLLNVVKVDLVSKAEAVSYLSLFGPEPGGQNSMAAMIYLAFELGGQPLALKQAARYILENGITPREYFGLLQLLRAKEEEAEAMRIKRLSIVDPTIVRSERAVDIIALTRKIGDSVPVKTHLATVQRTDPSRTTKDSGYGSYEPSSVVQEDVEGQEETADVMSVKTLSSFVDLGLDGRLRDINIFASDLVQSLSPDISEVVEGRELVVAAIQDALRAYSYSLEQQSRLDKTSDERKAAHFVRQQSHDIALKVVDQVARARSAESGESPREAGMFAEPINVLSWIGSSLGSGTHSLPVTAEDSDHNATNKDLAREDTQLNDTIQRMRDFLSDNSTFEWLKQRIQTVMSTGGGGNLTLVSEEIFGLFRQKFSASNDQFSRYRIDWDPGEFLRYNYSGYVDIASVVSMNTDGQAYEACTVGEYITRAWPITGPRFLEVLENWWSHVSDGREQEPFECSLLDGEITLTQRSSHVHAVIAGPMFLTMEIGEQLAWLGSICRKGLFLDEPTLVRPIISQSGSKGALGIGIALDIGFEYSTIVQHTGSIDDCCWLKLFHNCCIADGVSVSTRQEEEKGLELPFSLMATLGGFDRVANYAGQLVLKGFEALFVPMRKSGGSIVWHLLTKPNGRRISYNAMYALSKQPDTTVCMQDLYDSRHFLGWVSNASQHAGTEDGVYNQDNEVFLDPRGQGLVLSGVAIIMSKIVGIAATITPGRQDRGIRTSSKEMFYVEVVEKMSKMHVLLYDHDDGRGWLVDGASAVLHLLRFHVARYRPICDGERFTLEQFQYADSTAGVKSARDVLLSREMRKVVLVEEPLPDSERQVTETVGGITTVKTVVEGLMKRKTVEDRVRDLYEILELMYDSWKRRKTAPGIALETLNMKLEGWKFQDVVELENDMNPVVAKLDGSADDWLRLVRHVNTVVLIGNGFGDMMKPMGDFCANWTSVPQKDFCVAVPVSRLKRIAQKYGDPRMIPIKLTPDVYWPINQHPFTCTCASSAPGRSTCYRGQTLRSNGLRSGSLQLDILTAAEHANGAVIFEGRRPVRQTALTLAPKSPEDHTRNEKLAWMRKIRNRFRSGKGNGRSSVAAA